MSSDSVLDVALVEWVLMVVGWLPFCLRMEVGAEGGEGEESWVGGEGARDTQVAGAGIEEEGVDA